MNLLKVFIYIINKIWRGRGSIIICKSNICEYLEGEFCNKRVITIDDVGKCTSYLYKKRY